MKATAPPSLVRQDDGGYESVDGRFALRRDADGWAVIDRMPGRMLLVDGEARGPMRVAWRARLDDAVAALADYVDRLDRPTVVR